MLYIATSFTDLYSTDFSPSDSILLSDEKLICALPGIKKPQSIG
jgi:hypothetical protein